MKAAKYPGRRWPLAEWDYQLFSRTPHLFRAVTRQMCCFLTDAHTFLAGLARKNKLRRYTVLGNGYYNMDCLEGMKLVDGSSVDMILTDLPYGTTRCRWDVVIPFKLLWQQYNRIIKDNGAVCLFGTEPFSSYLRLSNIGMYKYDWIWKKTHPKGHLNAKIQPMRAHENISVFYKKQPVYNPQMTHGHTRKTARTVYIREADGKSCYGKEVRKTEYDSTDRYPLDVQEFSNAVQTGKIHSTQKPVRLLEYLIMTYTNTGGLVLDSCAGSCSTGIACHNTGRKFIGFEKDREIFKAGKERFERETAQMNLFSFTGTGQ